MEGLLNGLGDMMHGIVETLAADLNKKKEDLIYQRISERVDTHFDIKEEAKRRFKRIVIEFHESDQSEHYYWNDGSINGLHLISFYNERSDAMFNPKGYHISANFTYK